jgi:hypothetical protein
MGYDTMYSGREITSVSEEHAASFFRVDLKMEAAYPSKVMLSPYKTTRCYNPSHHLAI